MSAKWLECFQVVLDVLDVPLEMTAPVLWIAEGERFVVHHNLPGGGHIFATMAHNSDILCLQQSLGASLVSCWMGQGGRTAGCLEMVTARVDNYTPLVGEIHSGVAPNECLCSVYFQHYYLMLPHCPLGVVVSQTARLLSPYWSSLVVIRSSTFYVNERWWYTKYQFHGWLRMKQSIVENVECSSDLWRNEGLLYASDLSRNVLFHCIFDPTKPRREKKP